MRDKMYSKERSVIVAATPEVIFDYMDQLGNTGMHMMKDSAMMMGSKLNLEQVSKNATGLNSKFRWYGKMMGIPMDFSIVVTKWIRGQEKVWETIGESKMIILKWYRMRFELIPKNNATNIVLSITYSRPQSFFYKILSVLLSGFYANWCLKNMLNDTKANLEKT